MCPDLNPRAVFNLEPHENITRCSPTLPGFLLVGRQTVTFVCFDAVLIPRALHLSCTMKLRDVKGSASRTASKRFPSQQPIAR